MNKVKFVMTTCGLFSLVYSASLFGADFTATASVGKTGIGEIRNNPFFNGDENEDSFNPAPVGIFDTINPHQPSKINKPQENIQFSDTGVSIKDDYGPIIYVYNTETWEYEMTTIDPLNRGGYPPEVVASLLG